MWCGIPARCCGTFECCVLRNMALCSLLLRCQVPANDLKGITHGLFSHAVWIVQSQWDFERKMDKGSATGGRGKRLDFFAKIARCERGLHCMHACLSIAILSSQAGFQSTPVHIRSTLAWAHTHACMSCRKTKDEGGICDEPAELAKHCCPVEALVLR